MIWYETCESVHRENYERIGEGIANLFGYLGVDPFFAAREPARHLAWFESIERRATRAHSDAEAAGYDAGYHGDMWQASVCAETGAYGCDCDMELPGCGSPIPMGKLNRALYTSEYVRGTIDGMDDE